MDIRYSTGPNDVKRYTTEELRKEFLITGLYQPDTVQATYSHVDRMVVLGIMPVNEVLPIDKGIDVWANFGTSYFLERREAGVFNLGGPGYIQADVDATNSGKSSTELKFSSASWLSGVRGAEPDSSSPQAESSGKRAAARTRDFLISLI